MKYNKMWINKCLNKLKLRMRIRIFQLNVCVGEGVTRAVLVCVIVGVGVLVGVGVDGGVLVGVAVRVCVGDGVINIGTSSTQSAVSIIFTKKSSVA
jgi:hypothetical protein